MSLNYGFSGEKQSLAAVEKCFQISSHNGFDGDFLSLLDDVQAKVDAYNAESLSKAGCLRELIETDKYGYYHATNEGGYISWYDFTVEIFRQAAAMGRSEYSTDRLTVAPVTTAEYGVSKAARPFNSRLDKSKLVEAGFTPLPTWQDALARYLEEIEF